MVIRNQRLIVLLTDEEKTKLNIASNFVGQQLSPWIRGVALAAANDVKLPKPLEPPKPQAAKPPKLDLDAIARTPLEEAGILNGHWRPSPKQFPVKFRGEVYETLADWPFTTTEEPQPEGKRLNWQDLVKELDGGGST
jgi:hypothetical protein